MEQNQLAKPQKQPKQKKHRILKNPWLAAIAVPLLCIIILSMLAALIALPMKMLPAYATEAQNLERIAESVARYLTVLLAVLAVKKSSGGTFRFGFTGKNLKESILFSVFVLAECAVAIVQALVCKLELQSAPLTILMAIMLGIGAGVFEEPICRGIVMSNMMSKWVGKKQRILLSVSASALFFGLIHLLSLQQYPVLYVATQVIHAIGIGIFFGAVYARTRNLWGPIIMHSLFDFSCFMFVTDGQITTEDIISSLISTALFIAVGLFLIRRSKHADIEALWNDQPAPYA